MTLIPSLKHRLIQVDELIDITGLPGWRDIRVEGDQLWVGAGATHQSVSRHSEVRTFSNGLSELAGMIGDPQVRARGTMGGSVANNDPAADYPAAVLGLNATIKTQKREIVADDFFLGMFSTALASDEIIEGLRFNKPLKSAYAKFRHAATGYAMAGVFVAQISKDQWRVAVTGMPIGSTRQNLASAVAGETHEYTDMYPGMAKTARDEGFDEVADWFETLAKAERSHANRYQKALTELVD